MTQVQTTDRVELFKQLQQFVEAASALTYLNVSIADAAVSPLYITLLSLLNKRQVRDTPWTGRLLTRFKEKIDTIQNQKKINDRIKQSQHRYAKTPYLFFPVEPTHLHQMVPVLRQLQKKGSEYLVITNRLSIYDKLVADGFHPLLIEYPFRDENRTLDTLFGGSAEEQLKTLVERYIDSVYAKEYSSRVRDIFEHYALPLLHQLSQVLSFVDPKVVVVGYDITLEGRILTLLAKQMNIRSVCIQHGSISGEPLDHCHIVDNFLAYGNAAREYLVSRGLPPSSCIVTGAPYLDNVRFADRFGAGKLKQLLSIDEQHPYILVALSGPGHGTSRKHFNKIVTTLLQASADHPGYQFIIKLHRKDTPANYKELIAAVPRHRVLIVENGKYPFNIFEWLTGCSLLITGTSTVAQEAMLMQVPVMTIDLMNEYHDVDFIDQKCTVHVKDDQEVSQTIYKIIEDPQVYEDVRVNARNYAQHFFSVLDGNAAARCAEVILESSLANT